MVKQIPLSTFLGVALIGCNVGPTYHCPDVSVPCEWHSPIPDEMEPASSPDNFVWWEGLNDPVLNSLIERASVYNLDLQLAASRILQSRAERKAKNGDIYPHIDASANYDHVYYSKDALVNGLLGTACPIKDHVRRNVDFFEIGFDAEWEIDLFGVVRHEMKALEALEDASKENFCDVWITLSAEVAKNYIELRSLQKRLEIIDKSIGSQQESVQLITALVDRGILSEFDLRAVEGQLNAFTAQRPLIHLGINKTIHHLSILLGYSPGDLSQELLESSRLPELPSCKPIGVPSELLRRRPDIRKAERELAAATERIGVAIASLFPRFSLRGFIGDISTHAGSLFSPASGTWMAGPQLLVPIFNSKLLLQEVNYNKLLTQQSIYRYQKTVLLALEETENAISSYHFELERNRHLTEAYQANRKALDLMKDLSARGLKNEIDYLEMEKALFNAEGALLQSQVELLIHYVSLYKALAGGWCDCSD